MLGDDVHSIHIEGAATNFHCYGLALERLADRRFWHARSGEWRAYNDVGQIVEARPDRASPGTHLIADAGRRAPAALLQLRQGALGRDEVEALQDQVLEVAPVLHVDEVHRHPAVPADVL